MSSSDAGATHLLMMRTSQPICLEQAISGHANNFTWIRLVLAATVVYYHSFYLSSWHVADVVAQWRNEGDLAVDAFFFLSGLFVMQSLARAPNPLDYAVRRFLRIFPGYFFCLVASALLVVAISDPATLPRYLLFSELYRYILHNARFDFIWVIPGVLTDNASQAINGSIWTLSPEVRLYTVLGIAALTGLARHRLFPFVAAACLIMLAVAPGPAAHPWNFFDMHGSRVMPVLFAAGVLCFGVAPWYLPRGWHVAVLVLAVIVTHGVVHEVMFYAALIALVLWLGTCRIRGLKPLKTDLSFGIYIYGFPVAQACLTLFDRAMNPYLLTIVALAATSLFAAFSWRYIEAPSIALGHHLSHIRSWLKDRRLGSLMDRRARFALAGVSALVATCLVMQPITDSIASHRVVPMNTSITALGQASVNASHFIGISSDQPAIWAKLDQSATSDAFLVFDDQRLKTECAANVVTAWLPITSLTHAGDKPVYLERRLVDRTERSPSVQFHVVSGSPSDSLTP